MHRLAGDVIRFTVEIDTDAEDDQADLIGLAIRSRLVAMGHTRVEVTRQGAEAKPAFRRGGDHQPGRNPGTTEWQHASCSDGSTPVIDARYAGTCCSCLGRIEEGDEICAYE